MPESTSHESPIEAGALLLVPAIPDPVPPTMNHSKQRQQRELQLTGDRELQCERDKESGK